MAENNAIKAAKTKAANKWAKLDAQTVPLYGKISDGKATEADFEKLSKIYKEQSKIASKTFQDSLAAAKASAKDSVKKTVKSSVKAKQLLSTAELKTLLETTISIALEKSSDLIRTAVNEALEDNVERVNSLIRDVRRMQVKNDEVLYRLRQQTVLFSSPDFFKQLLEQQQLDKKQTLKEKIASFIPSLPKLPSFKQQKELISKDIDRLANLIAAKVTIALTAFDEAKEKTKRTLWDRVLNRDNPKSIKARAIQAKFFAKEFLRNVLDLINRQKPKVRDTFFGRDSFISKSFSRVLDKEDEIESKFAVRTVEDVDSYEKLEEAINDYKKLDEDYRDEERDAAKEQEATFSDKALSKLFAGLDWARYISDSFVTGKAKDFLDSKFSKIDSKFEESEKAFYDKLEEDRSLSDEEIEKLRSSMEKERADGGFTSRAYRRYRDIILRSAKQQMTDSAKAKLAYIRRRLRRYNNRALKFAKWFGIAYIASVLVNSLQSFMPTWREDLSNWFSSTGQEYLETGAEKTGTFIGNAITATLGYLVTHADDIGLFLMKVVGSMAKSIFKAVLTLLGFDPEDPLDTGKAKDQQDAYLNSEEGRAQVSRDILDSLPTNDSSRKYYEKNKDFVNNALLGAASPALDEEARQQQIETISQVSGIPKENLEKALNAYIEYRDKHGKELLNKEDAKLDGASNESFVEKAVSTSKDVALAGVDKAKDIGKKAADFGAKIAQPVIDTSAKVIDAAKDTSIAKAAANTASVVKDKAVDVYNTGANYLEKGIEKVASINPSSATSSLFQQSPFTQPISETLKKTKDAVVSGVQSGANTAKVAAVNTIDLAKETGSKVIEKATSAVNNMLNSSTDAIPTYLGSDILVQNLNLTNSHAL